MHDDEVCLLLARADELGQFPGDLFPEQAFTIQDIVRLGLNSTAFLDAPRENVEIDLLRTSTLLCNAIEVRQEVRMLRFVAVAVVLSIASPLLAQDTREAPIRAIVEQQAAAWTAGDCVAYARASHLTRRSQTLGHA